MDLRASLILAAAAGLSAGCLISAAHAGRGPSATVATLDARVGAIPAGASRERSGVAGLRVATRPPPLFPVVTGPEVTVRLDGLVRSPGRIAALLSIDGGPAEWLQIGETRAGVTLQDVASSSVTLETARGPRQVALGADPPPAAAAAAPPVAETPPPGYRSPPEPASAPDVGP